ncbi:hypothetical protein G647_09552 [Cladophialophora carrionii CBS 160.54]|uniref:Ubiquitin-like domain-containing protein n=1 Tax=Cladophialophora carrionii CBS 160.54 TaxID=1279043 RepID=V9DN47_9EURO|nr:uncharacterized protein G647_09552 [Cladophialophora carrionii CBS 160.54]ETI27362.1 hypothetical protein G647_09552 [Cladophialophora carrionii CBS 160.54]
MKKLVNRFKKREPRKPDTERGADGKILQDPALREPHECGAPNKAVEAAEPGAIGTYSGFDDWLSSFTPTAPTAAELPDEKVHDTSKYQPARQPEVTIEYTSQVHLDDLITIILDGVRKPNYPGEFVARLLIPIYFTLQQLNDLLLDNGFAPVLAAQRQGCDGFSGQGLHGHWTAMVVNGPSCYSRKYGLRINAAEAFSTYLTGLEKVRVECRDSCLLINDAEMVISFQRTLRLPDDDQVYDLPEGFGKLPLFNISSFSKKLNDAKDPNVKTISKKGGVFLPLYQREATWIKFDTRSSPKPFAVRVFVGGINAISGRSWDAPRGKGDQDYITVPPQECLDGIAIDHQTVRQFVAMPLGSGYSIEQQMTGKEDMGGFQMEITPSGSQLRLSRVEWSSTELKAASSPASEAMMPGDLVRVSEPSTSHHMMRSSEDTGRYSPFLRIYYFQGLAASGDGHNQWRSGCQLQMTALYALNLCIRFYDLDRLPSRHFITQVHIEAKPWETLLSVLCQIDNHGLEDYHRDSYLYQNRLVDDVQVNKLGIKDGEVLDIFRRAKDVQLSKSWSFAQAPTKSLSREGKGTPTPHPGVTLGTGRSGWDMVIAPGARLRQKIYRDPWPPGIWRREQSVLVPIQILNSVAFESLTGMLPPPTPITAEAYVKAGIPFYTTGDDDVEAVVVDAKGMFETIKSVGQLDAEGEQINPGATFSGKSHKIACMACKINLCDCV